jgi:arylsulfatase A-like enzyme
LAGISRPSRAIQGGPQPPHERQGRFFNGLLGAPGRGTISASGPNFVSLPGYTEIFSGRAPIDCADNRCAGARRPTLVDAFRDRASADADVAVIASWAPIARAATEDSARIVVSAGRDLLSNPELLASDPSSKSALDAGEKADPYPGHDDFRPDRYTAALALAYLRAHEPDFLFVGLGEADEYAHANDYRGYLASLRAADDFFARLFEDLEAMGERGRRTLVLVTADHGRSRDCRDHGAWLPESARVWLFAIGGPVRARGLVQALVPHKLSDIAPTIRRVSGLPEESADEPASGMALSELF